ncbi:unnamed protein product [Rotaria sordida]|uniref:Uncharacterized protein n=1 Tax=Rotaria sordida TaxID=392033 RepID=A0A816CEQ0_9BILA|nr:unnamed protein product [Rotaria sordida]CAF1622449.1 unnamed protein product [Rotaria sordida]
MASSKDQSLLDIYSTQLTNFIVASLFKLRLIDPFIVTFRALANGKTIRNNLLKPNTLSLTSLKFFVHLYIFVLPVVESIVCLHIEKMVGLEEQSLNSQLVPKYLPLILQILLTTKNK